VRGRGACDNLFMRFRILWRSAIIPPFCCIQPVQYPVGTSGAKVFCLFFLFFFPSSLRNVHIYMTSMTFMTSTARVRARSRAPYPYIQHTCKEIIIFSKFQSVSPEELILENRKMPSEWLGVHRGRSYGASPRGSSLPGPAVVGTVQ
jgi:hypothetical protein